MFIFTALLANLCNAGDGCMQPTTVQMIDQLMSNDYGLLFRFMLALLLSATKSLRLKESVDSIHRNEYFWI